MTSALKRLLVEGKGLVSILASYWKLLAVLSFAVFATVVALVLLLPQQYDKEVSLSITPRIGEIQERLGQRKLANKEQTGRTALVRIRETQFGPVEVVANYEASAEEVEVLMRAYDRASLEEAARDLDESLDESFRENYEESLVSATKTGLANAEAGLASNRTTLAEIDTTVDYNRRVGLSSSDPAVVQTATSTIQSLEAQRTDLVASIEQKEENLEVFKRTLEDPRAAADEAVEVAISSQSQVRQAGASFSPAVSAAVLAVTVAVTVVLRVAAGRGRVPGGHRREETPAEAQGSAS